MALGAGSYQAPAPCFPKEKTRISILWIAFAILAIAVFFDLRSREIPDALSVCLLLLALGATGFKLHRIGWLDSFLGFALGLCCGLVLFRMGGFGGGDVKLMASLGAVLGFMGELGVMFYVAIIGAILSLISLARGQKEFAYAPAIALGMLCFILRGYLR